MELLSGKALGAGEGCHAAQALPNLLFLRRGVRAGPDDRSGATRGFDEAISNEQVVGVFYGGRVDTNIRGDLAHGIELVAGKKLPAGDGQHDFIVNLLEDRTSTSGLSVMSMSYLLRLFLYY